jgi:EAL domain-containing protein (putative c-di-GMP-specific phosphodiesterase class I)
MEALARWVNDELGFVSPAEFVELAEEVGSIHSLGFWVIETVCKQINAWKMASFVPTCRVAINVSAIQLAHIDFLPRLMQILSKHDINSTQIELELTESGLLHNLEQGIEQLQELRSLGFTIALDDFGTGYSSLSHLKDLPIDVLKIDRAFVSSMGDAKAKALASAIVTIGRNMELSVVAEGVEERSEVQSLTKMNCDVFQGYYFARPMKAEELSRWSFSSVSKT